jgi:beta-galactosidase/beta-glucuronidase
MVRRRWTSLDGSWAFAFDDENRGLAERWFDAPVDDLDTIFDARIEVPYCPQAKASGVSDRNQHEVIWYARTISRPGDALPHERIVLHFGAVDHHATVWIGGSLIGEHHGGHTPFSFDITHALTGDQLLVVRAEDRSALDQPRGKQYWRRGGKGIFYTATSGIWQTVWLEPVPRPHLVDVQCTPAVAARAVDIEMRLSEPTERATVRIIAWLEGRQVADVRTTVADEARAVSCRIQLSIPDDHLTDRDVMDAEGIALWSPDSPRLYDLVIQLCADNNVIDQVATYTGLRTVDVRDGRFCLNGRPYEQRLVLDQGYWPDTLMTPPSADALRTDIELAKQLGFNGARKHQKIEDPRYLYWADRLGFLVWAELPSAYRFTTEMIAAQTEALTALIQRDRSHPCVIAWVPMNESWGTPSLITDQRQRALLQALYHLAHALDGNRPVVSNDGWEQAATDVLTLHDYRPPTAIDGRYDTLNQILTDRPAGRAALVPGHQYSGQPILVSEFGGINLDTDAGWGYDLASNADELVQRLANLVRTLRSSPFVQGFCYTQLTDVEQETNGLTTADRVPKADRAAIRAAILGETRDREFGRTPTEQD